MNEAILMVMAFGALIGGLDNVFGNRFGVGQRFTEAFQLLGSLGLSMAGILCISPILSVLVETSVVPLFLKFGIDPGIAGSILAIDMGGYQMAMDLAVDPRLGRFSGIILSAIFGCTIVFTIPVGMGMMNGEDKHYFTSGLMIGLGMMPVGILAAGRALNHSWQWLIVNCLPIFVVSAVLLVGMVRVPEGMAKCFGVVSKGIQKLSIIGLTLGAVSYMTGWEFLPAMISLTEAMEVVCSIAIVMLGSMPLAELIQRFLKAPLAWVRRKTGLNEASTTALLVGMVGVVPALAMFPRMDRRGKVVNGAFLVSAASAFAAHLGFTISMEPDMAGALLTGKLFGGLIAVLAALFLTRGERCKKNAEDTCNF